jgi:hypothetical protein
MYTYTNNNNIVTTWNQNDLTSNYTFTPDIPVLIESIYDGTNRTVKHTHTIHTQLNNM